MQGFMINRCIKTGINRSTRIRATKKIHSAKKRVKKDVTDKLSQLPDELLMIILSLLPLKEAARTSVLSNRWCKLWTFIPNLNFDPSDDVLVSLTKLNKHLTNEARHKYIDWVNSVLNSYQGTTIHEFHVRFDLDADYSCDIDLWVQFAIQKKVESLTMHFPVYLDCFRRENHYPFPSNKQLYSNYVSLRKLDLMYVDISEDFIQHLISSCPCLEELAIVGSHSKQLLNLNIDGSDSSLFCLKHLKIISCSYVKSIYLSVPNLTSFEYEGEVINISYGSIPNLVDVSFGGKYFNYIVFNFPRLSNYVVRLETLTLRVQFEGTQPAMMLVEYPELPFLRTLKLDVQAEGGESILFIAPLIKAAPSLHKLELELVWYGSSEWWEVGKIPKCAHQCLKEVEIHGFLGLPIDMEFVIYVLENALALEKITLHRQSTWEKADGTRCSSKRKKRAMEKAIYLKSKFSLGKKLVLL